MLKHRLPRDSEIIPDRAEKIIVSPTHFVMGRTIVPPFPEHMESVIVGMGCFWGAERVFWETPQVYSTSVGYAGGITKNPTYEDVCSGRTGHTEVVYVTFDPVEITLSKILQIFWENHDPTQGMRQGNDRGTQYRSAIYYFNPEQHSACLQSRDQYQALLDKAGLSKITTEVTPYTNYYYAESYHQQYLAKVPSGYCGIGGTGVCFQESVKHT